MTMFTNRIGSYARKAAAVVQLGCFIHLFGEHVAMLSSCGGPSMLPTLNIAGDYLAVESISTHRATRGGVAPTGVQLGDVVVSTSPLDPHKYVCKRVLGMPGDVVCIDPTEATLRHITVPKGHVWLQGDNLDCSRDSRTYGPVPLAMLRGRVAARIWPEPRWIDRDLCVVEPS